MADEAETPLLPPEMKVKKGRKFNGCCGVVIEPVIFIYQMTFMASMPLNQQYIYAKVAEDGGYNITGSNANGSDSLCYINVNSSHYQEQQEVQALSAKWLMYLNIASCLPAIFVSIVMGAYSDKRGRKVALIPPMFGCAINAALTMVVIYFRLDVPFLFLGYLIFGLTGGGWTAFLTAYAYLADTVPAEKLAMRLILIEMAIGLSGGIGQLAMGYIIKYLGFFWSYSFLIAFYILLIIYCFFFVPESVQKDPTAKLFTLEHFRKPLEPYFKRDTKKTCLKLWICLICFFFILMVDISHGDVITLFMLRSPLCWDSVAIGIYNAVSIVIFIGGGFIIGKLLAICMPISWLVVVGALSGAASQVWMSFVQNDVMMWMVPLIGCCLFLCLPLLRTIMSRMVPKSEYGSIFSSMACTEIVCSLVGTTIFDSVYAATVSFMPGFVFLLMATLQLFCVGLLLFYILWLDRGKNHSSTQQCPEDEETEELSEERKGLKTKVV